MCGGRGDVCAHVEEGEEDARDRLLDAEQDEEGGRLSATSRTLRLGHLGKSCRFGLRLRCFLMQMSDPGPGVQPGTSYRAPE